MNNAQIVPFQNHYGTLETNGLVNPGKYVRVRLPFSQLRRGNLAGQIIAYAKANKVYAKGLGILNCISTLK